MQNALLKISSFNIKQHWIQAASYLPKKWRDSLSSGVGEKARTMNTLVLFWYHQYEKFLFLVMDMEKNKGGGRWEEQGKERVTDEEYFSTFIKDEWEVFLFHLKTSK